MLLLKHFCLSNTKVFHETIYNIKHCRNIKFLEGVYEEIKNKVLVCYFNISGTILFLLLAHIYAAIKIF